MKVVWGWCSEVLFKVTVYCILQSARLSGCTSTKGNKAGRKLKGWICSHSQCCLAGALSGTAIVWGGLKWSMDLLYSPLQARLLIQMVSGILILQFKIIWCPLLASLLCLKAILKCWLPNITGFFNTGYANETIQSGLGVHNVVLFLCLTDVTIIDDPISHWLYYNFISSVKLNCM